MTATTDTPQSPTRRHAPEANTHFDQSVADYRGEIDIQARVGDFETQNGFPIAIEQKDAPTVRALLREQIALESANQGDGDTEAMKRYCTQLFSLGLPDDIRLIWDAKHASMNAGCTIDVQLLCGIGLPNTIAHLHNDSDETANRIVAYLESCVRHGDFNGFAVDAWLRQYAVYHRDEPSYTASL